MTSLYPQLVIRPRAGGLSGRPLGGGLGGPQPGMDEQRIAKLLCSAACVLMFTSVAIGVPVDLAPGEGAIAVTASILCWLGWWWWATSPARQRRLMGTADREEVEAV